MRIQTNLITLPCSYSFLSKDYSLKIYGTFTSPPPTNNSLSKFSIDLLNLDGEYIAVYENFLDKISIVFRSHIDSFSLFYIVDNDSLYLSNNLFDLIKITKELTWNKQALADYFEAGWNNIQKKDRTPFREITKLPVNYYMEICSDQKITVMKWNNIQRKKVFTMKNIDEFKQAFLSALDYYLKIYISPVSSFTVSSGIDSSTIACYAHQLFPQHDFKYFSSKIVNNIDDESRLTKYLNSFIKQEIVFLIPDFPVSFVDAIRNILTIVQSPYSDIEGIAHFSFFEKLAKYNIPEIITGFGADLTFGGTPYEYPPLIDFYLKTLRFSKARNVFFAYQKGIGNIERCNNKGFFEYCKKYYLKFVRNLISVVKKTIKFIIRWPHSAITQDSPKYFNIILPKFESSNVKNYNNRLDYASTDSALRQLSALQNHFGIRPMHPFEGYRFALLASKCDPYIFANGVNKYCERYAVSDLIPKELLNQEVKVGNPGYNERTLYQKYSSEVLFYLEKRLLESESIIYLPQLIQMIKNGETGDFIFRALNIVVFEEMIENKFGIRISS
jgi:asparagine synthetase B (glutamine-hydrolysing)